AHSARDALFSLSSFLLNNKRNRKCEASFSVFLLSCRFHGLYRMPHFDDQSPHGRHHRSVALW
ncbi:MAG: hypothetical protein V1899_09730, partial [Planctomycetota bacterium]